MVARPATEPVNTSTKFTFFLTIRAYTHQDIIPAERPIAVLRNAVAARLSAFSAPPELKPNQPNHSNPVPTVAIIRLLGAIEVFFIFLLPSAYIAASAENPAVVCITAPPAKSAKPSLDKNPKPQTQCATGI